MTAVATSLLLSGTLPARGALPSIHEQSAPQPDDSWKTDPGVKKAADTILDWLTGATGTADKAKSQREIEKKFPELNTSLVVNAVQLMIWQGSIRRTGDGNESSPYRYWVCESNCG